MVRKNLLSEGAAGPAAPGWVCVGVVTQPKGVRGEVRIKSFTAAPTDFVAYGPVHRGPDGPVLLLRVAPPAQPGKEALAASAPAGAQLKQRTTSPRFQKRWCVARPPPIDAARDDFSSRQKLYMGPPQRSKI